MIRVKLMSILVNDQNRARRFYTDMPGFAIKHDIPLGEASWLTLAGREPVTEPFARPHHPLRPVRDYGAAAWHASASMER